MDDLTIERSFGSQATWVIDVLGLYFWRVSHGCFYNQAIEDVRSTGAGIKCLYCRPSNHIQWNCIIITSIFCSDRAVARRQIEELGSFGYRIYFAPENEFFLASKDNLSKPFFDGDDWGTNILADGLKSYIFDVIRKAKAARIQVEAWHIEYNPGQVEITLEPEIGLQAADNWLVFRQGVKETALLHGLIATFMSKPFMIDDTGSGSHFNHSIWTHGGENAFWNPEAEDNLSEFARHWVAGLLAHAPAMTALCNPTVNCYRRLHIHFTPHLVNWGIDNRTTLVRVKNHSQDSTFAEGRLPSSAANPYIVIAAYIAAGMDGVKKIATSRKGWHEGKHTASISSRGYRGLKVW